MGLIVKWSHVAEGDFQGEVIAATRLNIIHLKKLKTSYVSVSYTNNTTVLANLTVYTVYVVNVSALSSGGIGPASTVKARTDARGTKVYNIVNSFLISLKN